MPPGSSDPPEGRQARRSLPEERVQKGSLGAWGGGEKSEKAGGGKEEKGPHMLGTSISCFRFLLGSLWVNRVLSLLSSQPRPLAGRDLSVTTTITSCLGELSWRRSGSVFLPNSADGQGPLTPRPRVRT